MPPLSKRRRTDSKAIEEINFDPEARHDYLTGFHKRKLQRAKHAQQVAEKKARLERIEQRRKLREERKHDLERHVAEINALIRPIEQQSDEASPTDQSDCEQEWHGIVEPLEVNHEAEYIDEDRYTTVTVETMELSRDAIHKSREQSQESLGSPEGTVAERGRIGPTVKQGKKIWTKEKPEKEGMKIKRKRKKFRYENKAERKLTRSKEKSKNSRQAKARRSA